LISRDFKGFEVLDYAWARQSEHESAHNILGSVAYARVRVRALTPQRIMFETVETVVASDGERSSQTIEVRIENEADAAWRVVQERIMERQCG